MTLLGLQRDFSAGLVGRSTFIPKAVNATAGFGVYRNAYRRRLGDCLRESFAKTRTWIGDDEFDQAADQSIDAYPSNTWTLSAYGRHFPGFLATCFPNDPEIAELAALEDAMRRAFDGPHAAPMSPRQIDVPDWDHAIFRFVPTFELLPVMTNCAAIWTAIGAATDPPAAGRLSEPASLCVWRKALTPCFRTVVGRERAAIEFAARGVPLGEFCRRLAGDGNMQTVAEIGSVIAFWWREEMLSEIFSA